MSQTTEWSGTQLSAVVGLPTLAHRRIQREVLNITGRFCFEFQAKLDPPPELFPVQYLKMHLFPLSQGSCLLRTGMHPGETAQAILPPGDQRDYTVP